jgi:F-type H+-transporting ATPase subunit beta
MTTSAAPAPGTVIAVRGAVVDVGFVPGHLPPINEELVIEWDRPAPLIVEVQAHLDETVVRGVALQATAGLRRGVPVCATGGPIKIPAGDAVLGRLIDVTGDVRDNGPPLPADMPRAPIHRSAPALADRSPSTAMFETGIKVIDLARTVATSRSLTTTAVGVVIRSLITASPHSARHSPAPVPRRSCRSCTGSSPHVLSHRASVR